jgi:hypothetical protein
MPENLPPEAEAYFRDALRQLCEALYGPRDAAAEQADWERFRDTKLREILAATRELQVRECPALFAREASRWVLSQALDAYMSDPDSGWASTFVPRPGGGVEQVWFLKPDARPADEEE